MGKYYIQQYKSVLYELNNKKTELKDSADDNKASLDLFIGKAMIRYTKN